MILTGSPVHAGEALTIGLVNRVVENGKETEKLAMEISKFPQTCLREDKLSTYEQFDYDFQNVLMNKFDHSLNSLKEVSEGIKRFIGGEGRHDKL